MRDAAVSRVTRPLPPADQDDHIVLPRDPATLTALQGEARVRAQHAISELRDMLATIDPAEEGGVKRRMRLNEFAHRVSLAVETYGRLLP